VLLYSASVVVAGVAFTKHLIHLYAYHGSNDLRQHLEACFNSFFFNIYPTRRYLQWQNDVRTLLSCRLMLMLAV
jgi:hypothetical protein